MKKKLTKLKCIILTIILTLTSSIPLKSQVLNGYFEQSNGLAKTVPAVSAGNEFLTIVNNFPTTDYINNWTYVSGNIDLHHRDHFNMGVGGQGNQHIDLNGNGIIRQTITVVPNVVNTIRFITRVHENHNGGSATARIRITDNTLSTVFLTQNWTLNFDPTGKTWTQMTYTFTPTTSSVTLEFKGIISSYTSNGSPGTTAYGGVLIDAVELVGVPSCDESLLMTKDCNTRRFSLTHKNTENQHTIWTVNGIVVSNDSIYQQTFAPGTHTICVHYLATQLLDSSHFCCEERCTTITIDPVQELVESYTVCDKNSNGQVTYNYDPTFIMPIPFDHYVIQLMGPPPVSYNSLDSGNRIHKITPGLTTIEYFDSNNCVIFRKMINLIAIPVDTSRCTINRYVPCGNNFNVDTSWRRSSCCNGAYTDSTGWTNLVSGSAENPLFNNLRSPKLIRKVYYDSINCRMCIVTVNIAILRTEVTKYITLCGCMNYSFSALQNLINLNSGGYCSGDISTATTFYIRNVNTNSSSTLNTGGSIQICEGDELEIGMSGSNGNGCCVFRFIFVCAGNRIMNKNPENKAKDFDYLFENNNNTRIRNEYFKNIKLHINPNPTSSIFKVQPVEKGYIQYNRLEIVSSNGKIVSSFDNVDSNYELDLSKNSDNFYLIRVLINDQWQTLKVIKSQN